MREKIRNLERSARRLDPGPEERAALLRQAADYALDFLDRLPDLPAYTPDPGVDPFDGFPIGEKPRPLEDLLPFYRAAVDTTGILPSSGGQMGYIPGAGLLPSALGDLLADVSNRYSGVAFAGPGAARMEGALVRWMCSLVGYPAQAAGDLASGGSIATLSALVTARDAHGVGAERVAQSCIYLTGQAHHCVDRALHVAGLGQAPRRRVPMDSRFRMELGALARLIEDDRKAGLRPWLVIGSAGTTDTGAIDPIERIAEIAEAEGLWFHLDAAYGGFFSLCDEVRERLAGMARADSIVMDPHKGLGVPYGSGAVLVREGSRLAASNRFYADYMQDAKHPAPAPDAQYSPADYSPELTRPFRGPRMWFPLMLFGLEPFRASLAEKIWLARYFHHRLGEMPGFERGPEPDLSIVTFRFRPGRGDAEAFNQRLLRAVHEDGRVFITSTRIDGVFTLRLAVLNFRTHLEQVDYLLDLLQREAARLESG